jgi:hypothetical protein
MAIILKANKVNLFVSSDLFVFWYHSPNLLDTPRILSILAMSMCTQFIISIQFLMLEELGVVWLPSVCDWMCVCVCLVPVDT